jgi:tryptophanyl-tRNA synthetase
MSNITKKRILSGIQPTGQMHLGNYLGAIKNWVALQHEYDCLFMLADMHAITVPQNPNDLRQNVRSTAASYIACGIAPDKVGIFVQSAIPQHAELAWIFNCITPLGWLNRMTQFKEKAGKNRDNASLGLYSYPVLMAADILLYKANVVPVGDDQKQHLELCRDIAGAFNRQYEIEYFTLPEPLIMGEATRIMSLRDGKSKMSKSDPSDASRIHLDDSPDNIRAKLRKAKSDMIDGISYDVENRPEVANLLTIYASMTNQTIEKATNECESLNFSAFKERIADSVIAHLAPISEKYLRLIQDQAYLNNILNDGNQKATLIAQKHMAEIKQIIGFQQ